MADMLTVAEEVEEKLNNVGVERTKVKRVEMEALVKEALASSNQLLSKKHEAMGL